MDGPPAPRHLLDEEHHIRDRLGGRQFDFVSMQAISNIYRAAAAVRRRAEREVLAPHGLSWGGFTILWVLWVWGEAETAQLATECDLAKGTLTGMLSTLEKQDRVTRTRVATDRRRVLVTLTPTGLDTIEQVFPAFNAHEAVLSDGLTERQKLQLAALLRVIITTAQDPDAEG